VTDSKASNPTAAELLARIGTELADSAPGGWRELRLVLAVTGPLTRSTFEIVAPDGGVTSEPTPVEVFDPADDLRAVTADPGAGAWFTCRITVHPDLVAVAEFDYDAEPAFDPPPVPDTWAEELERFPRDAAHIPAWLSARLGSPGPGEP
jgi:hypothetical protein